MPIALIYPNHYKVGMSSLGFQLVYSLLNEQENIVCERFFLPEQGEKFLSVESGRSIDQFPFVLFSISFEHDYLNLVQLLKHAGLEPLSKNRGQNIGVTTPLVLCGGVATFMNPEPLASFIDMFFIGEAEAGFIDVMRSLIDRYQEEQKSELLLDICKHHHGCYVPSFYEQVYDDLGRLSGVKYDDVPFPIKKMTLLGCKEANHSQVLTPEAEFSELFLTELGRGCSRGCRFCTAGFIYRPPRLWDADAVISGIDQRFEGVSRVGLLGMEMMDQETLAQINTYLLDSGCALSFSSLRADRIDSPLLALLSESNLKNVAIAPDGSSERLRRVINKGLDEKDILAAAENLVSAGIFKLKLYLMIGLPTETDEDLLEAIALIEKIQERINPIGKERGRLCEISVSVNCFAPKPWTPFQFNVFGGGVELDVGESRDTGKILKELKHKQKLLKSELSGKSNVSLNMDKPENVLFQALLARGDRRLGDVLLQMVLSGCSWKQAMKKCNLTPEQYVAYGYGADDYFPWSSIDHGIKQAYLWEEYLRAFEEKESMVCDVTVCKRCGVCNG